MSHPVVKIRAHGGEERGEITIAARSERPADLSRVMRAVVIPELLNVLIPVPTDLERV